MFSLNTALLPLKAHYFLFYAGNILNKQESFNIHVNLLFLRNLFIISACKNKYKYLGLQFCICPTLFKSISMEHL